MHRAGSETIAQGGTALIKIAVALAYIVFAVLLNSVGAVILQSINYFHVSKTAASTLEACKDLPIAIVSFLIAGQLSRIGYRRGMIGGLSVVSVACALMPVADAFWATRLLFVAVGTCFGVVKVAAYASVGLVSPNARAHAGSLTLLEGMFMVGVLGGYWLFGGFIGGHGAGSPRWLDVYYVLAAGSASAAGLLAVARLDERAAADPLQVSGLRATFSASWALARQPLTAVFIAAVSLYVLIEQGIGTWLPTFNSELLGLSPELSVEAASIFAGGLAAGRLGAGLIVRRTGWFPLLLACLAGMAALILVALPLAAHGHGPAVAHWADAPLAALVLPLVGAFMGPIYPALNSTVLSAIPVTRQPTMVGIIVVASAIGGTTGSLITGQLFRALGPSTAFYSLLIPVACLLFAMVRVRQLTLSR